MNNAITIEKARGGGFWVGRGMGAVAGAPGSAWTDGGAKDAIHVALNMSGKLGSEAAYIEKTLKQRLSASRGNRATVSF